MKPMPDDFVQAVHQVLRRWYTGGFGATPWGDLWLVAERLARSAAQAGGSGSQAAFDFAVRQVLLEALELVAEQVGDDAVTLLRLRFLDDTPVHVVANRLNVSENVVYHRQREAIAALAAAVWHAAETAGDERTQRFAARLEIAEPPRLFGVQAKLDQVVEVLALAGPPWIVALDGLGGIGKTTLADAVVRELARTPAFADVAWVSARQDRFTLWGGLLQAPKPKPALSFEGLLDAVIEQFGWCDLMALPLAQPVLGGGPGKQAGLSARFKACPYLVVVDNLETAADYQALVPDLQALINPSKVLITSRHSLHAYERVYCLSLNELTAADSLALLRHEASERGLADVAAAPDEALMRVYEVTGGNPLALKLVVGQMYTLSLPQVVDDLRQARGETVEGLYRHIYWRAWHLLSNDSQRVLAIMPLLAESGGGLAQIASLSGVADDQLPTALQQLATLSLVNVRGTWETRRYSIHRLTETFLLHEVVKWQT